MVTDMLDYSSGAPQLLNKQKKCIAFCFPFLVINKTENTSTLNKDARASTALQTVQRQKE